MQDVLKKEEFEELLVANWTKVIDSSRIIAYCLKNVRDKINEFSTTPANDICRGLKISLSRFTLVASGFIIWVEFTVPVEANYAVGTTELHMNNTGDLSHVQTVGTLHISMTPNC